MANTLETSDKGTLRWLASTATRWWNTDQWAAYRSWLTRHQLVEWWPDSHQRQVLDIAAGGLCGAEPLREILTVVGRKNSGVGLSRRAVPSEPPDEVAEFLRHATAYGTTALEQWRTVWDGWAWPGTQGTVPFAMGSIIVAGWAICYDRGGEKNPWLLVGDLGGIQQFLYTVVDRGALRSLRARSLAIDLVSRSLAADLGDLSCGPLAELMVGGGRFWVLIPEGKSSEAEAFLRQKAMTLQAETGGRLSLRWAAYPCPPRALYDDATGLWSALRDALELARTDPGKGPDFQDPAFWQPTNAPPPCGICSLPSAEREPLADDDPLAEPVFACPFCRAMFSAGSRLARVQGVIENPKTPVTGDSVWQLAGYRYWARGLPDDREVGRRWWAWPGVQIGPGLSERHMATRPGVVVTDDGTALNVREMAEQSQGGRWVGVGRADVDHAGRLFTDGLASVGTTLMHMATLSRSLDAVFGPALSESLVKDGVTLIYGGGDDACWVGPWDAALEAAWTLHDLLQESSARNNAVTLSAGIVVASPETPIRELAQAAGRAEESAKDAGRNRVTMFSAMEGLQHLFVVPWPTAVELHEKFLRVLTTQFLRQAAEGRYLEPISDGGLTRSLVRRATALAIRGRDPRLASAWVWLLARWRDSIPKAEHARRQALGELSNWLRDPAQAALTAPFWQWIEGSMRGEAR